MHGIEVLCRKSCQERSNNKEIYIYIYIFSKKKREHKYMEHSFECGCKKRELLV